MSRRGYYRSRKSNNFGYRQSWVTGKGRLGRDSVLLLVILAIVVVILVIWKSAQFFDSLPGWLRVMVVVIVLFGFGLKVVRGFKEL